MRFQYLVPLGCLLAALTAVLPSMGQQAQDAIALSEDLSRSVDDRLAALRKEIATNDAAIAQCREAMARVREQARTHQRETMDLQKPLIDQDEELLKQQKNIEEKEQELVRLRQQFHGQLAKHPLVKERRDVQMTLTKDFMASEAKLQELLNRASGLNSALKGLEVQKKEAEAKRSHETSQSK